MAVAPVGLKDSRRPLFISLCPQRRTGSCTVNTQDLTVFRESCGEAGLVGSQAFLGLTPWGAAFRPVQVR